MAGFIGDNLKTALFKSIEAIGKGASSLADGAQKKLDEMKLENRRREILNEIPKCVNELYAQGIELPAQLNALMTELADVDEMLAAMRPAPQPAAEEPVEEPVEEAAEEAAEEMEEPAEEMIEETIEETVEPEAEEAASEENEEQE